LFAEVYYVLIKLTPVIILQYLILASISKLNFINLKKIDRYSLIILIILSIISIIYFLEITKIHVSGISQQDYIVMSLNTQDVYSVLLLVFGVISLCLNFRTPKPNNAMEKTRNYSNV